MQVDSVSIPNKISCGDNVRFKNNIIATRCFAYLVIIVIITMSLWPLLSSGFYSDDLVTSVLKGQLELQNKSLLDHFTGTAKEWIVYNGRYLMTALFLTTTMSYLMHSLLIYKTVLLLMVIVNVLIFGWFVDEITNNRFLSYLAMILMPLMFQFRLYHDPMLSHYGLYQIQTILILCSMTCFHKYIKSDNRKYLMLSIISFNIVLYLSEISLILFPLFAIIVFSGAQQYKYSEAINKLKPIIYSALIAAVVMVAAKLLKDPLSPGYSGNQLSLNALDIIRAMFVQLYATMPLSYYASNPSRLFQLTFTELINNMLFVDIVGAIIIAISYVYIIRNIACVYNKYSIRALASIGTLLTICPAFVIALSAKYQKELHAGIGYLQVYIQYFGAILIFVAFVVYVQNKLANSSLRYFLHTGLLIAFVIVYMINVQNNRLVIDKSNIDMHYRRIALIGSLRDNILGQIPENSIILIKDQYDYNPYPMVISDTRGWADYGYAWKNAALVYMYSKKRMNVVTDLNDLRNNAGSSELGSKADNIYLLNIKSYPLNSGNRQAFVILSKVENLHEDKDGILRFQSQPLRTSFPDEKG